MRAHAADVVNGLIDVQSMSPQRFLSVAPASVSCTSCVVRCTRRIPSSASRRETLRLTLDLETPSARAAAEELFSDATFSKSRRSLRSTIRHSILPAAVSRSWLKVESVGKLDNREDSLFGEERVRPSKRWACPPPLRCARTSWRQLVHTVSIPTLLKTVRSKRIDTTRAIHAVHALWWRGRLLCVQALARPGHHLIEHLLVVQDGEVGASSQRALVERET